MTSVAAFYGRTVCEIKEQRGSWHGRANKTEVTGGRMRRLLVKTIWLERKGGKKGFIWCLSRCCVCLLITDSSKVQTSYNR